MYAVYSNLVTESAVLFATRICVPYTAGERTVMPPYKLLAPYMYIVTAVVYGLEKMESCLCHILFFIIMIDWKSFYANGGCSNGNSDPLSYENGCNDEDEEYTDIMREEWHRRMEEE